MKRKTSRVLGYDVDLLSFSEASLLIQQKLDNSLFAHVVTLNPEIIEMANNDSLYSDILRNADLVIPDGSGIELALRLKGIKQERIPGIDFAKDIIKYCHAKSYPIALVGAKEEVIQKALSTLKSEFENINICYAQNGYFSESETDKIISKLIDIQPKYVLVALGAPKQEFFISKCKASLKSTVFIGVGGSFDVWAGVVDRAPVIFQKLRCEWLYRTLKQPQRIKRIYKTLPLFVIKAIMDMKK